MGTMGQTLLHLVDRRGETLPVAIRLAVEAAHRWVRREYPHLDAAVVAGWAEDVGKAMGGRLDDIRSPIATPPLRCMEKLGSGSEAMPPRRFQLESAASWSGGPALIAQHNGSFTEPSCSAN